jgi:hypothetical protein
MLRNTSHIAFFIPFPFPAFDSNVLRAIGTTWLESI